MKTEEAYRISLSSEGLETWTRGPRNSGPIVPDGLGQVCVVFYVGLVEPSDSEVLLASISSIVKFHKILLTTRQIRSVFINPRIKRFKNVPVSNLLCDASTGRVGYV
jgi:hypothetical protein